MKLLTIRLLFLSFLLLPFFSLSLPFSPKPPPSSVLCKFHFVFNQPVTYSSCLKNPNHTELAWIFNCITPMGKLRRMTTWKSRLATSRNMGEEDAVDIDDGGLNLGLFAYPVLQAADILAYRCVCVFIFNLYNVR